MPIPGTTIEQARKLRMEMESELATIIQNQIDTYCEQTGLCVSGLDLRFSSITNTIGPLRLVLTGLNFNVRV